MPQIDVEIDDFLSNCDKWDIKEIIKCLIEDGHIDSSQIPTESKPLHLSCSEMIYEDALDKLKGKWNSLSKEDEEIILKISNKL
jgi:hypothetical protein